MPRDSVRHDPRFLFWLTLVALLALSVRELYVLTAIVDHPDRGDVRQYLAYAWNLIHHGVFSLVQPQAAVPPPDAYRSPGYPWLIAACMKLWPNGNWYMLILQVQVLLGTATVMVVGILGRAWLPRWAALTAAVLLAFWPHHIVATGALLSEVLFGFTLVAGLLLYARGTMTAAGAVFGLGYLVNPLIGLFPVSVALLHRRSASRRAWAIFLGVFLIPVVALAIRNASIDAPASNTAATGQPGRLATNLVQGSWPLYHAAQNDAHLGKAIPIAIMHQINDETRLLDADPAAGLAAVSKRIGAQPVAYARWYFWDKPWLLWDWDIRVGIGGPYFLATRNSPLQQQPLLRAITHAYRTVNPVLTLLAAIGLLLTLATALRGRDPATDASKAATATALLALYLTALHVVLQSEPRYANAYRGIEALLVMTTCAWLPAIYLRYRRTAKTHSNPL